MLFARVQPSGGKGLRPLCGRPCVRMLQMVVVVDADVASHVLGNSEGLSKSMEPHLSDKLLSHRPGHHTLFSSGTNTPYWRLIRKGTAPAFKAENIKCALAPVHAGRTWGGPCHGFPSWVDGHRASLSPRLPPLVVGQVLRVGQGARMQPSRRSGA